MKRKPLTLILIIFLLAVFPAVALAGSAILHWQPNTDSDLAGYRIYYGTAHRSYGPYIPVGTSVTSYTLNGLVDGKTYYFALTAVDTSGNESGYSGEVAKTIPSTSLPAKPTCDAVNPPSVSSMANATQAFETTYSYEKGADAIDLVRFLVSTDTSVRNAIYVAYNASNNRLYLRNNSDSNWLGGHAPGSSNVISNSYGKLDCSGTTVVKSGNALRVTWSLVPSSGFGGQKNLYMKAEGSDNQSSDWVQKGNWTINVPAQTSGVPTCDAVNPPSVSSMANATQAFETTYSYEKGADAIDLVRFLVNTDTSVRNAIYVAYNASNNRLYLRNNSDSNWLGGHAPGSSNVISNSYGKLDCSGTTVVKSGNALRVTWSLVPSSGFGGQKNLYMKAEGSDNQRSDWIQKGNWTINVLEVTSGVPSSDSVTPSSVSSIANEAQVFETIYSFEKGVNSIKIVRFLVNSNLSEAKGIYVAYNEDTNKLYLRDNSGKDWRGGYAPGSSKTISNSYGSINCADTVVSKSGNTLRITWSMAPTSSFGGQKNLYMQAEGADGQSSNWTNKGSWTINVP